jgi:hypothetical protein
VQLLNEKYHYIIALYAFCALFEVIWLSCADFKLELKTNAVDNGICTTQIQQCALKCLLFFVWWIVSLSDKQVVDLLSTD